ncbi:MAG: response regulator [Paracoccaceae bacterium]
MPAVHIIDDEDSIRDALGFLFASRGIVARCWPGAEPFLAAWPVPDCACIILDVRMQGLSGPEAYARLRDLGCEVPVIFLTGHADVPVAVSTLKAGAFDFLEKPFNDNQIVDLALAAMQRNAERRAQAADADDLARRLASLSDREAEVMQHMVKGLLNKQIAASLGIAMRTVEVHRGRVLAKMAVRNATELATLLSVRGPA